MPSHTLEMRHRAQIAGVCPGSFLNRLEGIALSLRGPEVTQKQVNSECPVSLGTVMKERRSTQYPNNVWVEKMLSGVTAKMLWLVPENKKCKRLLAWHGWNQELFVIRTPDYQLSLGLFTWAVWLSNSCPRVGSMGSVRESCAAITAGF